MQGPETSSSTPSPLKPTRAAFIRGLPEAMPVEEVIERGREMGISINPSDVHSARYYMRQQAASQSAKAASQAVPAEAGRRTVLWSVKPGRVPVPSSAEEAEPEQQRPAVPAAGNSAGVAGLNGRGRKRGKAAARGATPSEAATAGLEAQLQVIVLRVGSDRVREIIARMESAESVRSSAKE
jgi:hypothetical protein